MVKEFEELDDAQTYVSDAMMNDYSDRGIINAVNKAKKDAWNAAIRWAAENADSEVKFSGWGKEANLDASEAWSKIDKQSILNGLID